MVNEMWKIMYEFMTNVLFQLISLYDIHTYLCTLRQNNKLKKVMFSSQNNDYKASETVKSQTHNVLYIEINYHIAFVTGKNAPWETEVYNPGYQSSSHFYSVMIEYLHH